jgi:hypothetical protein
MTIKDTYNELCKAIFYLFMGALLAPILTAHFCSRGPDITPLLLATHMSGPIIYNKNFIEISDYCVDTTKSFQYTVPVLGNFIERINNEYLSTLWEGTDRGTTKMVFPKMPKDRMEREEQKEISLCLQKMWEIFLSQTENFSPEKTFSLLFTSLCKQKDKQNENKNENKTSWRARIHIHILPEPSASIQWENEGARGDGREVFGETSKGGGSSTSYKLYDGRQPTRESLSQPFVKTPSTSPPRYEIPSKGVHSTKGTPRGINNIHTKEIQKASTTNCERSNSMQGYIVVMRVTAYCPCT